MLMGTFRPPKDVHRSKLRSQFPRKELLMARSHFVFASKSPDPGSNRNRTEMKRNKWGPTVTNTARDCRPRLPRARAGTERYGSRYLPRTAWFRGLPGGPGSYPRLAACSLITTVPWVEDIHITEVARKRVGFGGRECSQLEFIGCTESSSDTELTSAPVSVWIRRPLRRRIPSGFSPSPTNERIFRLADPP